LLQSNQEPRKDLNSHIGLNVNDIPGAVPKNLKIIKGTKRQDFFPYDEVTNKYYNKEAVGKIKTGAYRFDSTGYQTREAPHDRHILRRHYPDFNNQAVKTTAESFTDNERQLGILKVTPGRNQPINSHAEKYQMKSELQKYN